MLQSLKIPKNSKTTSGYSTSIYIKYLIVSITSSNWKKRVGFTTNSGAAAAISPLLAVEIAVIALLSVF
jgi:hypothetical protein